MKQKQRGRRKRQARGRDLAAPAIVARRNTPWRDCVEIEGPDGIVATLYLGDCVEVMQALEPESLHSVVTDPPYELGFMGKAWDKAGGVATTPATWEAARSLLMPGGHLVAFAGSRTYHRIASAIEAADFEIRDQLMWIYGSGFPKSLDISKAIDASDAKSETPADVLKFTEWMRSTGITARQINEATGSFMASHYLTSGSQPAVPTADKFDALRPFLPKVPKWVEKLVADRTEHERQKSANLARREVIGHHEKEAQAARWRGDYAGGNVAPAGVITRAYTDEAKRWEGWGTALKPAHEPIALARKPFRGPVAGCVMAHGTGGLNVDGCRIGGDGGTRSVGKGAASINAFGNGLNGTGVEAIDAGRWPANVVTDGSPEVLEIFPAAARDAIRFFYAAKASREDRDYGLGSAGAQANVHPTVKPVDLMRWLCRLITQPGGALLDPFTGSGSTGIAAVREGMRFVGIEQSPEYFDIARRRITAAAEATKKAPDLVREIDKAVAKMKAEQMALL